MILEEGCRFLQQLCGVQVSLIKDGQYEHFETAWQFHELQTYLSKAQLPVLLASIQPKELLCSVDSFQVRFIFLKIQDQPVIFGPYCCEMMSETDCALLLHRVGLFHIPVQDISAYRSAIPFLEQDKAFAYVDCLIRAIEPETVAYTVRTTEYQPDPENFYIQNIQDMAKRPYAELVQERYEMEQKFMEYIWQGKRSEAIQSWRKLHNYVAYLKKELGETLEVARMGAAITRTLIRLAAADVGIPALLNDRYTAQSSRIIREARTIDEINREHERLIRQFCQLIHDQKENQHSVLVQSALYYLEHEYRDTLSIGDLAEELGVSTQYLIEQFHQETGTTPNAYLNKVRLHQARLLLATSSLSIQEISARVGILDANYFAKLFKKEFGQTPKNYRKLHRM